MKKPVDVRVVEEADIRVIVSTFADGTVSRQPIEKTKPARKPIRPFKRIGTDRTRKKQF